MFRALAQRMGFDDDCFSESEDQMMDVALESDDPWLKGIDRDRLEREGHVRLNFEGQMQTAAEFADFLPFANGSSPRRAVRRNFTARI